MDVREEQVGAATVLTPAGDLDLTTLPEFGARIDRLLARGVRYLVWDLSAVEILPSTALGYLLQSAQRVHRTGGRMVLAGARRAVLGTLRTMGIVGVFSVFTDRAEALAALAREIESGAGALGPVGADEDEADESSAEAAASPQVPPPARTGEEA